MPAKTNETNMPAKKSGKTDISRIMEEAPLFAGLDGFMLRPAEKEKKDTKFKVAKEAKKNSDTKKEKTTAPKKSTPQKALKPSETPTGKATDVLLSVKEMCSLLKVSRATLVRMDKSGQLPGRIKLSGSVRFHRETVESWLHSLVSPHSAPS